MTKLITPHASPKRHPRGESPQHQLSFTRQQLPRIRRTPHTISELSATQAPTPDFGSFIEGLQRQPLDQTCHSKVMPDVAKASNRQSLPQHVPNPQYPQVKANRKAPPAYAQCTYQTPIHRSLHDDDIGNNELRWTAKREKARSQLETAATGQEYPWQLLQNVVQDGSFPTIPRKVVHPTSRSCLRSCVSHQHLLINSHSLSGLSSSTSYRGNLDRRSNLGALGSHPGARSYELQFAERSISEISQHLTPHNTTLRSSQSGPSSSSPSMSTTLSPIPVASLHSIQRYYPMPSQYSGNGARSITTSLIRPITTTSTSSLPSIRIDHVKSSQQIQRRSMFRAAQQRYKSDVQRARSKSLAALTAVHPRSCRHERALPLSPNEPRQASVFALQNHLASLRHSLHSKGDHRPPPQYHSLLFPTFNEMAPQHRVPLSSKHRAVPRRESLAQWKAERGEARSISNSMRCTDTNEKVRRADEVKLERREELTKKGERGDEVGL